MARMHDWTPGPADVPTDDDEEWRDCDGLLTVALVVILSGVVLIVGGGR